MPSPFADRRQLLSDFLTERSTVCSRVFELARRGFSRGKRVVLEKLFGTRSGRNSRSEMGTSLASHSYAGSSNCMACIIAIHVFYSSASASNVMCRRTLRLLHAAVGTEYTERARVRTLCLEKLFSFALGIISRSLCVSKRSHTSDKTKRHTTKSLSF